MKLEDQLAELERLGLALESGITVDDICYSFDRDAYEAAPFDLILFILGSEVERPPWGRPFCSRVWNFDAEAIEDTGDYVAIARRLAQMTGDSDRLKDLEDQVDIEAGTASLRYRTDTTTRHLSFSQEDDWADPDTIDTLLSDLSTDGHNFYGKNNGQATILFYLSAKTAKRLGQLTDGAVMPMLSA